MQSGILEQKNSISKSHAITSGTKSFEAFAFFQFHPDPLRDERTHSSSVCE
jgi:hypothetical protein